MLRREVEGVVAVVLGARKRDSCVESYVSGRRRGALSYNFYILGVHYVVLHGVFRLIMMGKNPS